MRDEKIESLCIGDVQQSVGITWGYRDLSCWGEDAGIGEAIFQRRHPDSNCHRLNSAMAWDSSGGDGTSSLVAALYTGTGKVIEWLTVSANTSPKPDPLKRPPRFNDRWSRTPLSYPLHSHHSELAQLARMPLLRYSSKPAVPRRLPFHRTIQKRPSASIWLQIIVPFHPPIYQSQIVFESKYGHSVTMVPVGHGSRTGWLLVAVMNLGRQPCFPFHAFQRPTRRSLIRLFPDMHDRWQRTQQDVGVTGWKEKVAADNMVSSTLSWRRSIAILPFWEKGAEVLDVAHLYRLALENTKQ
jgi:hypothetical protein